MERVEIMDRHLNLFYTYDTHHLEDNVTRAFIITLKNLSVVYQRLFYNRLISKSNSNRDINMMSDPELDYDLQIANEPTNEDKLTSDNGLIIGIEYSPRDIDISPEFLYEGRGRADAIVIDKANEFTFIFEMKLGDALYNQQITKYYNQFFDTKVTKKEDIFVKITWDEIAGFFEMIQHQNKNLNEIFLIQEFINYLDMLNLLSFRQFTIQDFSSLNESKLAKYVGKLMNDIKVKYGLDEDNSKYYKIILSDIKNENLWIGYDGSDSIAYGIVCGSGKKWRSNFVKDYLLNSKDMFNTILEKLFAHIQTIDKNLNLYLSIHSYFRLSYFRTGWIGDIGGVFEYPNDFDKFYNTFTNPRINTYKIMNKKEINEIFREEISSGKYLHPKDLDSRNQFPKWEDKDGFGQYCYFHINVQIPKNMIVGKNSEQLINLFDAITTPLRNTMIALDSIKL